MKQIFTIGLFAIISVPLQAQIWKNAEAIKLSGAINTEAEESMPVFSKDSSMIYFTRTYDEKNTGGKYDQDIWTSKKDENGGYEQGKALSPLNNKFNNAVFGISGDGTILYLLDSYEGKKDQLKGCAYSKQNGNSWSSPKHIDIPTLDIEGDAYVFYVNESESVLLISYKGPNTLGEEDLYVSRKENGTWTAPLHMGATINTSGFEISPFMTKNLDTLFFSSNGLGGLGDADIFYSVRQDDSWTNWSTPVNLGETINSAKFDAYFSITGKHLFWSSNRDGANSDIYTATFKAPPPLLASAIGTDVTVYNGSDGKIDLTPEGGVAPYTFKWSNGSTDEDPQGLVKGDYTVVVTDAIGQTKEVTVPIKEPDLVAGNEIGELINLNPIYFDMAKWNIRPDAAKELDKIVTVLNKYPKMVVELGSHTDCRSSVEYNNKLSEKRANESVAYIRKRIVNPDRIYGRGYGESRLKVDCPCEAPVYSNCSEDEHQQNRRTEFIVISKDGYKKGQKYTPTTMPMPTPVKPKESSATANTTTTSTTTNSSANPTNSEEYKPSTETLEYLKKVAPMTDKQKQNIEKGFYIVQPKETLFRVYKNTGVPVEELKRLNNLNGNDVKVGQKLKLK